MKITSRDLEKVFDILDEYNTKLNPSKCHFGMKAGKFHSYMVTKRGINLNLEQIKEIIHLRSPTLTKDIQRSIGREIRNLSGNISMIS